MEISEEKFGQIREQAEEFYKSIGVIKCPYLEDDVHFNVEGFEHLLFKAWNKSRTRAEQYTRLRLLQLVPAVIKKSHTLQEFDERKLFVRQKINSRWENRMKTVRYFVFVAIVKNIRLKVVVKEIEGGVKFFYSLYPSWRVVTESDGQQRKVFYSGDLETL
ncbi:hypothetical protein D4R52_00885 [bacterium]|nr:MAG: hypothetical protein D4R52_00885 [bacterium]